MITYHCKHRAATQRKRGLAITMSRKIKIMSDISCRRHRAHLARTKVGMTLVIRSLKKHGQQKTEGHKYHSEEDDVPRAESGGPDIQEYELLQLHISVYSSNVRKRLTSRQRYTVLGRLASGHFAMLRFNSQVNV